MWSSSSGSTRWARPAAARGTLRSDGAPAARAEAAFVRPVSSEIGGDAQAVDLAFHVCFSAAAAWLGVKAVRTRNEHYACQSTYLQAFQALVFALGAVSAFMLLLLLLVTSSGERFDVVGVLLNVAFALLYLTTGVYASRLQAEIDALEAPPGDADGPGPRGHRPRGVPNCSFSAAVRLGTNAPPRRASRKRR